MNGRGDRAPSRDPDGPHPDPPVAPIARSNDGVREIERRLGQIVDTIQEFASLRFDARTPIGSDGDIVDAVAAGVNFLGEELEASFNEIENRVAVRTGELAMATEELSHRALHDQLTGLANRALLWDRLTQRLGSADRRTVGFAVLFLDLDKFKSVNDMWGHAAGDKLLVDVAGRISAEVRVGDTAARMGGDEFVVLLDEVGSAEEAVATACRICMVLRAPYAIGVQERTVMASIGVAFGPDGFASADAIIAAADSAMYDAKRRGPGRWMAYSAVSDTPGARAAAGSVDVIASVQEQI